MSRRPQRLALLWLIFIAIATAASPQNVTVESSDSVHLSAFKAYSWRQLPNARDPSIQTAVIEGVDKQLLSKGLHKTPEVFRADMLVSCEGSREVQLEMKSTGSGNIWHEGGGTATVAHQRVSIGNLSVTITDRRTGATIWRGRATTKLSDIDRQKNQKSIDKALGEMFKEFPSRSNR
jgi:hypothetical protein